MGYKTSNKLKNTVRVRLSQSRIIVICSTIVITIVFVILTLNYSIKDLMGYSSTIEKIHIKNNKNKSLTSCLVSGGQYLKFTHKITVCAWIKWDCNPENGSTNASILSNYSPANPEFGQFWLRHNAGNKNFEFIVSTDQGKVVLISQTSPVKDKWYHLTGVYDSTKATLYVNGIPEVEKVQSGKLTDSWSFNLMSYGEWTPEKGTSKVFNGEITGISLWNKTLKENQIAQLIKGNSEKQILAENTQTKISFISLTNKNELAFSSVSKKRLSLKIDNNCFSGIQRTLTPLDEILK